MVMKMKEEQEVQSQSASKTRGTPAFCVLETVKESKGRTEADECSSFWTPGIDYQSVEVPAQNLHEDPADRLALLELDDD